MLIYEELGCNIGQVELIEYMGSDQRVVEAARVSYDRDLYGDFDEEKDPKLIKYLLKNGHTSPFEHCTFTFLFEVPLFVRSQHHRHCNRYQKSTLP